MSVDESVSNLRKRRGTVRKSITSLAKNVSELGKRADDSATPAHATILLSWLEHLDSDLKVLHFKLIDLIRDDDERTLDKEQDYLESTTTMLLASSFRSKSYLLLLLFLKPVLLVL